MARRVTIFMFFLIISLQVTLVKVTSTTTKTKSLAKGKLNIRKGGSSPGVGETGVEICAWDNPKFCGRGGCNKNAGDTPKCWIYCNQDMGTWCHASMRSGLEAEGCTKDEDCAKWGVYYCSDRCWWWW